MYSRATCAAYYQNMRRISAVLQQKIHKLTFVPDLNGFLVAIKVILRKQIGTLTLGGRTRSLV